MKKCFLIVGNWKMNPETREEAKAIFASISRKAAKAMNVTVVIAPPAPFVRDLAAAAGGAGRGGHPVHISAQDVSENASGAFTGSVSASELQSVGAEYAIIGHSERRHAGDTDEIIVKKVKQALAVGLRVILCVGETVRDSQADYLRVVQTQVFAVMGSIDKKLAKSVTITYEPVWAIGKSFDSALKPSDIHEMSIYIKKVAAEALGKKEALKIPVLYGGSVDDKNGEIILKESSIDGLLVGRKSLDPIDFGKIISYANSI